MHEMAATPSPVISFAYLVFLAVILYGPDPSFQALRLV